MLNDYVVNLQEKRIYIEYRIARNCKLKKCLEDKQKQKKKDDQHLSIKKKY
jgi:hypothetical protein